MTLTLYRRTRLLSLSRAGNGDVNAAGGVGALTSAEGTCHMLHGAAGPLAARAAIRFTTAEPGPRLRLATETQRLAWAPGEVACLFAAPWAAPPPASDSS